MARRFKAQRKDKKEYPFKDRKYPEANYPQTSPYAGANVADIKKANDMKIMKLRQAVDGRMQGMYTDRYSFWVHWREIAEVMIPRRYRWWQNLTPNSPTRGSPINQRIVDTTIIKAHRDAAAGMMAGITSPARPWFRLTAHQEDDNQFSPERLWLSECEKRMFKVISESNFYTAAHTVYEDLLAFGTAPMLIMEDYEDVFRCYNPAAGEYFVANSDRLEVNIFARQFTMTARSVVQWFGKENCSQSIMGLFNSPNSGQSEKEIIVAHMIEPYDPDHHGTWPIGKDMKFIEVYWEYGSGQNKLLQVKGYREFPVMVPRWYLISNDSYGRSPGMDALGETRQLMVEQRRKAQGIDKMVNPPLRAHISLKNQPTSTLPGALTYVASVDNSQGIAPIYTVDPKLKDLVEDIHEVQDRIRKIFFADVFLMISQYEPKSGVTATEMAGRQQEAMLMMGPMLERFQNEFLTPAVNRIFAIMMRAGLFPPPPDSMKGKFVAVEYMSILSQAQKGTITTALERFSAQVGNWAAAQPQVLDNVDFDAMADTYADALGVDPTIIVDQNKVKQLRDARAQQQQQQAMLQQTTAAVQGAKTLSDTNVGGGMNALEMIAQGRGGTQ